MVSLAPEITTGQALDYARDYIKRALSSEVLEKPNREQAGANLESLISLYDGHALNGIAGAKSAWSTVKRLRPALAELDPDSPILAFKPDDDMIATELAKEIGEHVAYFHSNWKVYDSGVWREQQGNEFRRHIRRELRHWRQRGVTVSQNRIRGLASMLEDDLFMDDRAILERQREQTKYINLRNGLFNLETMKLEPHRSDLYFTTQLDFDYDPNAKVNAFRRYLNTSLVLPNDKATTDETLVDLVLEVLGYCFTARTDLKASFWLYGGKDSGKSTFISLIKALMGDLYTTIDLTMLGKSEFLLAGMVGKRVIGFAEGESNTVLPDALYKTLTGGSDEIYANVKHKNPITFRMEGKIVWAMNNLPRISDRTGATTRRVFIIPYNRTIPEAERVSNLEYRLMNERAGIFNLAMDHLQELTRRGHFLPCAQSEQVKREYIYQNDTEAAFLGETCDEGESFKVRGSELYDAYKFWCERFGFHAKNMNQVALEWKRLGFEQKTSNGSWWHGVQIRQVKPL